MRGDKRKWIDIAKDFKSSGDDYYKGERIFESEEKALRWIKAGWAKDVSGELPTGVPDTAPKTLEVQSGVHGVASTKA